MWCDVSIARAHCYVRFLGCGKGHAFVKGVWDNVRCLGCFSPTSSDTEFEDYSVDVRPSSILMRDVRPPTMTDIGAEIAAAGQRIRETNGPSESTMVMLDQLRNMKLKYDKVRAEMKATSKKLSEVQRKVEKLPDFVLDKIHESS